MESIQGGVGKTPSRLFSAATWLATSPLAGTLVLLAYLALSALIHYRVLHVGFIADDFGFLHVPSIPEAFSQRGGIYRPFGVSLFIAAATYFGANAPIALHTFGLILHAFNAYLLFRLILRLTKRSALALLVAGLWLVNPAAVEPLYWLSALIFYLPMVAVALLTMNLMCSYLEVKPSVIESGPNNRLLTLAFAMGLSTGIALLFHEIAIALPLLYALLVYFYYFSSKRRRGNAVSHLVLWAPTAAVTLLYLAVRVLTQAPSRLVDFSPSERAGFLVYAVWRSFLPTDRAIWHLIHFIWNRPSVIAWLMVVLLIGLPIVFAWRTRSTRALAVAVCAAIIAALPPVLASSTGGRYLYLSTAMGSVALSVLVVSLAYWISSAKTLAARRNLFFVLAVMLLSAGLVLSSFSIARTRSDSATWLSYSSLVARLESQVERLAASEITTLKPGNTLEVLAVDFPNEYPPLGIYHTLGNRVTFQGIRVSVQARYLHNQSRQRSPSLFVNTEDLMNAQSEHLVLIYCSQSQTIFDAHSENVPCLSAH